MLIINGLIVTMEGQTIENGYIATKDGKITHIGAMDTLNLSDTEMLDANGGVVLPGFIDCHCHLGLWGDGIGIEGEDGNEDSEPITPHLRAIDAINSFDRYFDDAVNAGVTTVLTGAGSTNPIAGQWCAIKTLSGRVDDMVVANPVGMKFALGENPKMCYGSDKSQAPFTRMAIASLIREQLIKAKKYMIDIQDALEEQSVPPEYDIKCEALIPLFEKKIKAYFHVHRRDDIFTAIRIAEEFDLDYVLVHATEAYMIADQLKAFNPQIIVGPVMCDRSKPELKNLTIKSAGVLASAGIDVAICTDHPETPIQFLALSAALCDKNGLGTVKSLEGITITAAKIGNIEHRVGSLKVGKDADILIFDQEPFDVGVEPRYVIIDGKLVKGGK